MATEDEVARLKRIAPDSIVPNYTDEELSDLIDAQGSVRLAAGILWEERLAETAALVDVTEGSSQRRMSQEFGHAQKMVEQYLGEEGEPGGRRAARVSKIVRE